VPPAFLKERLVASDVDICNLALAYLGDAAAVTSISPPSGSAQASHCARFYPLALGEMLELNAWSFATTRATLAYAASNPTSSWQYCYYSPSDAINILDILAPDASDDYSVGLPWPYTNATGNYNYSVGAYTPQPFQMETDGNGHDIILTNQLDAVVRYTTDAPDISHAPPLFCEALTRLLAAKLAGPLLKGDAGRAEVKAQLQLFAEAYSRAVESDGNQRKLSVTHTPTWMSRR
jgi:hypothetical protein